jgi:predicted RNA-binding protein with TRAM domain
MSLKIVHKNSSSSGTPPASGDIDVGELAINAADAELYTKDLNGNIRKFQNTTTGTAGGVKFTQSGSGAVTRTVDSKLKDVVSVKDFGAVGDGVANDTTAVQAALSSGAASVYVPAGTYKITANLTRSGQTRLHGDGIKASVILFDGNFGLIYTGGDGSDHYNMSALALANLSFECTGKNTGALLDASWVDGVGNTAKSLHIFNCNFASSSISGGWAQGVKLTNARNVKIDNCRFLGDRDAAPITSGHAITVDGTPGGAPVEIVIDSTQAFFCESLLYVTGSVEGLYIDKSAAIACHSGILTSASPLGRPLLFVSNSHFNTNVFGIYNVGFVQVNISNCSFYCVDVDSSSTTYTGIQFDAAGAKLDSHIVHNDFQQINDIGTTLGIVIDNDATFLENVIIDGNTVNAFDIGILLATGTNGVIVTDSNVLIATGTLDLGSNNIELGTYTSAGSHKGFSDGLEQRFGSALVTLDANGEAAITIAPAFPTSNLVSYVSNGDSNAHGDKVFSVLSTTTSAITFKVIPNPGTVIVRANYLAFGT